ncbi:hypothetical protein [Oceanobacillus alkalisoli]|uniref:hypothetical protein n=1 Tax=Oceanobacillus alkalisoli TaxID=2925113 RepID=UPI001EE41B34|nr:hypothetical protein [Oceanobacillus alkalisoli]MCG5105038.1 hypothetical protein [Oceanobacillus alkalisoli]
MLEPLTSLLVQELAKSIKKSSSITEQGDLSKLENEARLQEIENRISEYQARVAQELAIAKRIETAAEVEIEEFYDNSGSGGVGLQSGSEGGFNLGVNGNGRKVTKRIYRFNGVIGSEIEGKDILVEQELSEKTYE